MGSRGVASGWIVLASVALAASIGAVAQAESAAVPQERVSELLTRGAELRAVPVAENVWLVSGNSNAYLIRTAEGSVLIDTGLDVEAKQMRELLLEAVPDLRLQAIVLTHAHPDHVGGLAQWKRDGVAVIAHRAFPERNRDQVRLTPFRESRARVLWSGVMPEGADAGAPYPEITPDILVDDDYSFYVGGLTFRVIATPGAEGPDGLSVWVPKTGMLFTGDALGPTVGSFPNLFTLRGENLRLAIPLIETLRRLRALGAETLLPGHFEPVAGKARIAAMLERTERAVQYVHDATVAGMNEGKSLWTLMDEITLPPELGVSEQYGRVAWGVRAIWEAYTGWFRYESTTELFSVPPHTVYAELTELAGGPEKLAERASVHVVAGEPLKALHLAEVALAADPKHAGALEARLAALQRLAEEDAGRNFQVAGWLRHRIALTKEALGR